MRGQRVDDVQDVVRRPLGFGQRGRVFTCVRRTSRAVGEKENCAVHPGSGRRCWRRLLLESNFVFGDVHHLVVGEFERVTLLFGPAESPSDAAGERLLGVDVSHAALDLRDVPDRVAARGSDSLTFVVGVEFSSHGRSMGARAPHLDEWTPFGRFVTTTLRDVVGVPTLAAFGPETLANVDAVAVT